MFDNHYQYLIKKLLSKQLREDRTGVGTYSSFGEFIRVDLNEGFPLLTLKRTYWEGIAHELLWILSGDTNIRYLQQNNVRIWNEWADADGNLGRVYGAQWRAWGGQIDQISALINGIKKDPYSRRHLVSAWNVGEMGLMNLPPCHTFFQMYVEGKKLSCQFYMRSSDVFLGLPFNIASYALLTHLIAQQCDLIPHELIYVGGDVHLYANHREQAEMVLDRKPNPPPKIQILRKPDNIFGYTIQDFKILDYFPHPTIPAPVAV